MTTELSRPALDALSVRSESERLVDLRIVPYGVVASTPEGPEAFVRGAFAKVDPRRVTITSGAVPGPAGTHDGMPIVGRGESIEEREDGAYLTGRIARTIAGDELLALAADGVLQDASVTFKPVRDRRRGRVTERTEVDLRRVAILDRGAYPGASVLAVRAEDPTMPETVTEPIETLPAFDPAPILARIDETATASRQAWDDAATRIAAVEARVGAGGPGVHPLARFASFGDFCRAAWEDGTLSRALVDEITGDNPGVMPPAWLPDVKTILPPRMPGIMAFGGPQALPDAGMAFNWPTYTGDITALVAAQATQKTDVASTKISFGSGQATIGSYGYGHDVAYQLILRSSPSYIAAANRVLLAAYAAHEDAVFVAALVAAAGTGTIDWNEATGTADSLRAALFAASLAVEKATGAPASFALAGDDVFGKIGGLPGLWPQMYGTYNAAGTAQASTLAINVSGLPIIHDRFLATDALLVSNESAAAYHRDGPRFLSVDDASKIGRDDVIWGMGAAAVYNAPGIVFLSKVAGPGRAAAAK